MGGLLKTRRNWGIVIFAVNKKYKNKKGLLCYPKIIKREGGGAGYIIVKKEVKTIQQNTYK